MEVGLFPIDRIFGITKPDVAKLVIVALQTIDPHGEEDPRGAAG